MDYNTLANDKAIERATTALKANGMEGIVAENGAAALAKIKELIPASASVMNGSSRTLEQIGFIDLLKSGNHDWNNLHAAIVAEKDQAKQGQLRKEALLSDFYLGSVHAMTEDGQLIIASNTGSQLPHVVFSSPNLIFVVGAQKLMPNLDEAIKRLEKHVVPLEDERMMKAYGAHTQISKLLIFKKEHPMMGRKVRVIIVKEKLGF